jgi:stearoyl-CoA desaturase (delta-9 desaturase)
VNLDTLRAVLVNRMHILRNYARQVTAPICRDELRHATGKRIRAAKRLLIRDALLLDRFAQQHLHGLLAVNVRLRTVYEFRERLNALWNGTHTSNERLLHSLRSWIADAEASGLPMLRQYALAMRASAMRASAMRASGVASSRDP